MALHLIESTNDPHRSLWVFRYYDLNDRKFETYGKALVRLIDFIRELAAMQEDVKPKVNILAHSMGGLLVREAVQRTYPNSNRQAEDYINKIVTLGTPHQGVSFQIFRNWIGIAFSWADNNKLIWEGYLDTQSILKDDSITPKDMVMRLDFYLGERDLLGIGFSDNVIFRKQYYVRALLPPDVKLYLHTGEEFAQRGFQPSKQHEMRQMADGWEFDVQGTGFKGVFRIEIDQVPEEGHPKPLI